MNIKKRRQRGLNGQAYAQREFSRELLINRLEDLLSEAVITYNKRILSNASK